MKKVENGTPTYYLRSTVLGGQIVAELNASGSMTRGFVYQGGQLLAVQHNNQVSWVHEDPVVKSKRVTGSSSNVASTVELDPWGGHTSRSSNQAFQPRRFTTYDRDVNESDDAMHRRYNRWHSRFDQPDPYDGSYDMGDPQSFNRYCYVQNDPVNFVDPSGLDDGPQPRDEINPGDIIRTNIWDRRPRGNIGFREGNPGFVIETGPGDETGAGGGSSGSELGPLVPSTNADKDKCEELSKEIQRLRDELARRTDELVRDDWKLPATGNFSIETHQQQFRQKQLALRRTINEFNKNGCGGGLPFDAWDFATNPVPAPGRRNLPVHRVITPGPRPVPITPAPVPAVRPSIPFFVPLPVIIIRCVVFRDCGQGTGQTE